MKITTVNNNFNNIVLRKYSPKISFKGEFDDRVKALRSNYNKFTWWLYGESDSIEIVTKNMKDEILELEKEVAKEEVVTKGIIDSYIALKGNNASLLNLKESKLSNLSKMLINNESTINNLRNSLSNLCTIHNNMKTTNKNYWSTIQTQNDEIKNLVEKEKEIITAQVQQEKKLQENLDKKLEELRINSKNENLKLSKQVDANIALSDNITREINRPKKDGFGSIPGYKDEKEQIKKIFGQAVVLEKYGKASDVPNGILLFSPDKVFMKDFAFSIINQYNCNVIKIKNHTEDVKRIQSLREAAMQAQLHYEKNNQRSVILINDFDEFAPKNTRVVGPLKNFIEDISKKSHATIIATTTHPENLDDILLRSGRFDIKMPIPLLNNENLRDLIKMTLDAETLATTDIEEILQNIKALRLNEKLNIKSMKIIIKNLVTAFKDETIEMFENQKSYMKYI